MAVGAIAFGVGLAAALMIPSTPVENRVMGRASDTLKDEAKRIGERTAKGAREVAREAAHAARDETRRVREDEEGTAHAAVDDLKDAARRVVDSAKEAAREAAERQELTPEALRNEARDAVAHTREAVKRPGNPTPRRNGNKSGKGVP